MFQGIELTDNFLLNGFILAILITGLVVIVSLLMKKKGDEPPKPPTNQLDAQIEERKQTLPIQLQAYERLTLLMDRINLLNLLKRIDPTDLNYKEQQFQLVAHIRQEFEHNVTQQLYVSDDSWFLINSAIEGTISTINNVANQQPETATGQDLNRAILNHILGTNTTSPSQMAITQMRIDVGNLV